MSEYFFSISVQSVCTSSKSPLYFLASSKKIFFITVCYLSVFFIFGKSTLLELPVTDYPRKFYKQFNKKSSVVTGTSNYHLSVIILKTRALYISANTIHGHQPAVQFCQHDNVYHQRKHLLPGSDRR